MLWVFRNIKIRAIFFVFLYEIDKYIIFLATNEARK